MNFGKLLNRQDKSSILPQIYQFKEIFMLTILLVLQVIVAFSMVIIILIQRSSSDGLSGLGGGSSSGNSLISGRASANIMTKTTAFLAAVFMANSLAMATITARTSGVADKLIKDISAEVTSDKAAEPGVPILE
jgi:preprotein translocase subunit SecG